jgi:hypothetical protein
VASKKAERLSRIREHLAAAGAPVVGEAEWAAIRELLSPISDRTLRALLRECGSELTPLVEGMRQDSFEELERTLLALERDYAVGDRARQRRCRDIVITAKDHARMASRRAKSEETRVRKAEMVEWMLVWLENPGVFPAWVELRKRAK